MEGLRKIMKKLETVMSASAFAEAGEFEAARMILREGEGVDKRANKRPELRTQLLRRNL